MSANYFDNLLNRIARQQATIKKLEAELATIQASYANPNIQYTPVEYEYVGGMGLMPLGYCRHDWVETGLRNLVFCKKCNCDGEYNANGEIQAKSEMGSTERIPHNND